MAAGTSLADIGATHGEAISSARTATLAPGLNVRCQQLAFARNAEIFSQEDESASLYKVISGVVRATRLMDDGRRHIVAFYYPSDVFGMEGGDTREFNAEAVTDCRIACIRRSEVGDEMERSGFSPRELWKVMAAELQRFQQHSFILSRLSAVERVWCFLQVMAARADDADVIELPMSRTDIADHLGLTIETVSRAFTHLRRTGAIDILCARRIRLNSNHQHAVAA